MSKTTDFTPRTTKRKHSKLSSMAASRADAFFDNVANTITQVASTLATHQSRLDYHDTLTSQIQTDIRELRRAQSEDATELNRRIDTVQRDLTDRLDTQTRDLTRVIEDGITKVSTARNVDGRRIGRLEKWRWMIAGGAGLLGFGVIDVLLRVFSGSITQFVVKYITGR